MRVGGELDSSLGPNNSLGDLSPTGITEVALPDGEVPRRRQGLQPEGDARDPRERRQQRRARSCAATWSAAPASWPRPAATTPGARPGTTDNNGDAWFCGGTEHFTACVWVGHAQTNTPMETEYAGGPVDGGTFPAIIWSQVMQAVEIHLRGARGQQERRRRRRRRLGRQLSSSGYVPQHEAAATTPRSSGGGGGGGGGANTAPAPAPAPAAPAPGRRRHRRHRPLASVR